MITIRRVNDHKFIERQKVIIFHILHFYYRNVKQFDENRLVLEGSNPREEQQMLNTIIAGLRSRNVTFTEASDQTLTFTT